MRYLENPKVHGMIHSIRNAGTNRGLIGRVLDDLERTLQAAVSILAAVILTLPLLFTGLSSGQGALNNQDPGRFGAFFRSPLLHASAASADRRDDPDQLPDGSFLRAEDQTVP